jgi:hypothetical protein
MLLSFIGGQKEVAFPSGIKIYRLSFSASLVFFQLVYLLDHLEVYGLKNLVADC